MESWAPRPRPRHTSSGWSQGWKAQLHCCSMSQQQPPRPTRHRATSSKPSPDQCASEPRTRPACTLRRRASHSSSGLMRPCAGGRSQPSDGPRRRQPKHGPSVAWPKRMGDWASDRSQPKPHSSTSVPGSSQRLVAALELPQIRTPQRTGERHRAYVRAACARSTTTAGLRTARCPRACESSASTRSPSRRAGAAPAPRRSCAGRPR